MKKGISVHCHITGRHSSRSTFESGGGGGGVAKFLNGSQRGKGRGSREKDKASKVTTR